MLSHRCKSFSTTPRVVLLPSSLYKACQDTKDREAQTHHQRFLDEIFAKKIFDSFESCFAQPAVPDSRRVKSRENTKKLDAVKNNSINRPLKRAADSLLSKSKVQKDTLQTHGKGTNEVKSRKVGSKGRPMMISADSLESSEPPPGGFSVHGSANLTPETANPILGKEQLSSCGSASTIPPLPDSLLAKQAECDNCNMRAAKQKENTSTRFPTEQMKFTNAIPQSCLKSRVAGNSSEEFVGKRIRLWSPIDMCFNYGTVNSYDSQNSNYKITYDNGHVELLHLEDEKWEAIDSRASPPKECDFRPRECFFRSSCERVASNVDKSAKQSNDASSTLWINSSSSSHKDAVDVLGESDSQSQSLILDEISGRFDNRIVPSNGAGKGKSKRPMPKASLKKS